MKRYAGRNLVSIKVNTEGLLSWLCILHFAQCTTQGIKVPSENKVMGLAHRSLASPCQSFFPFPFRLIPWSAEAFWVHFPARASKTLSRRCSVPSAHWEGARCLCEQHKPRVRRFIGFLCKPRNISLLLSPLLAYRRLRTTRLQSIKGSQQGNTLEHCYLPFLKQTLLDSNIRYSLNL